MYRSCVIVFLSLLFLMITALANMTQSRHVAESCRERLYPVNQAGDFRSLIHEVGDCR